MVHLSEVNNMFWGLTIDGGKRYFQKVDKAYKVTMAALEVNLKAPKESGSVQVMVQDGSSQFLLCTLGPAHPQQQLNLNFTFGESVQFFLKGEGVVHLTGFLLPDGDESDLCDMDEESDADSELYDDEDDEDGDEWSPLGDSELYDEDDEDDEEWSPLAAGSKRKRTQLDGAGKKLKRLKDEVPSLFDEEAWEDEEDEDEESEEEEEDSVASNQSPKSLKALQTSLTKKASKSQTPSPSKKEKKKKDAKSEPAKADVSAAGDTLNDSTSKKKKKKKKNKPGENTAQQQESSAAEKAAAAAAEPPSPKPSPAVGKKRSVAGGTGVEDLKIGRGPEAKPGATVSVYYSGTLAKNNKRFDSCLKGKPFRFRLGRGEVIKGWDTGLIGMKVGGKRKITVPPSQGYGNARQGPIPPGSTLIFDVEMKAVS